MSFDLGKCIDSSAQATADLLGGTTELFNPSRFINPQSQLISGIATGAVPLQEGILTLVTEGGMSTQQKNDTIALYNSVSNLVGGRVVDSYSQILGGGGEVTIGAMGAYQNITDFCSGKLSIFPLAGLPGVTVPGMALIGTMTFAGLMGVAMGAAHNENALCKLDPDEPCQAVKKIFAGILGAYNAALNAIAAGLSQIEVLLNKLAEITNTIQGYIAEVIEMISKMVGALVEAFMNAMRYGLAKLMQALTKDPCMAFVMQTICGPDLQGSLGINEIIPPL